MGKGARGFVAGNHSIPAYSWNEIQQHNTKTDRWLVLNGHVYDVTEWSRRHPGGERILQHYAGQDATDAWDAFHNDKVMVSKFLGPMLVGTVDSKGSTDSAQPSALEKDFRELRQKFLQLGYFKPYTPFFMLIVLHIILLDALACLNLWYFGTGWLPYIATVLIAGMAQSQAGWSMHDFGHRSVFEGTRANYWFHIFTMSHLKGASSTWWNYRHYLHHAKPNVIRKDPDVRMEMLFLLGNKMPKEWGQEKKGTMPYQHQDKYFPMLLPPLLIPLYFHYEIIYYTVTRKEWQDFFWIGTFYMRWFLMYYSLLGFFGTACLIFFVRLIDSFIFVYVTQMNHIPMEIDHDTNQDWITLQLKATCNVDSTPFNDWFTGHLNYQVEHHLFPTMPRHHFYKVAPLVKSLCKKHGLDYQIKPLVTAMVDIHRSLKKSGDMWYDAYHM